MTATIYGIKNCDTMKKARAWLEAEAIEYRFHDYKSQGVERERLEQWVGRLGWERVLNRAGTTFRKLEPARREGLDAAAAVALMLEQPSMIRRPIIEWGGKLATGFSPAEYEAFFAGR